MDIISWLFTGMIVGLAMGTITPKSLNVGFMGCMGMGALGGVVLCFLGSIVGLLPEQQFSWIGVITAAVGAVGGNIVMMLFRKLSNV